MSDNSYNINYDWHLDTRRNHQKRHDYYLTALSEQNRVKKQAEQENMDADTVRKKELERGFSAYVNGPHSAKKRIESRASSRAASRMDSNHSPEKSTTKTNSKDNTSYRAHRKSWVDSDVLRGEALPDFVKRNRQIESYSAEFDESEIDDEITFDKRENITYSDVGSSSDSIPEQLSNISISSSTLHIPKLSPPQSTSKRKKWTMGNNAPFIHADQPSDRASISSSSSTSSSSEKGDVSAGDYLRQLNRQRREKNWLEESWNLIDRFEKNNKGRTSMIFDDDDDKLGCDIPEVIIETDQLEDVESDLFESVIPILPRGKLIEIEIISTWGDQNYVGLNGIEFWNNHGQLITPGNISSKELRENPLDPRSSFQNLNDGNYCTKDDMHSWLSEVQDDQRPKVQLAFDKVQTFSLIRVWNYNRNRVHANRGVRNLNIRLDNKLIFCGEITCASGTVDSALPWGDNILFTTDEQILEKIAENDLLYAQVSSQT